jgi:hypothetical protein
MKKAEDSSLLPVGPLWLLAESTPGLVVEKESKQNEVKKEVPFASTCPEDGEEDSEGDGQGDGGFSGSLRGGVTGNFPTGSEVRKEPEVLDKWSQEGDKWSEEEEEEESKIFGRKEESEKPAQNEVKKRSGEDVPAQNEVIGRVKEGRRR